MTIGSFSAVFFIFQAISAILPNSDGRTTTREERSRPTPPRYAGNPGQKVDGRFGYIAYRAQIARHNRKRRRLDETWKTRCLNLRP
ncbi:hypothetical protein B0H19DRAFT_1100238 [Mycena capillaripes]|nr:hypothetical protein B0H19DRAFT_1144818 [Mycena capillaripes]KAJ6588601.1 hypothetical protein B0H19DRAFT_1100238 [Mycena capillaripes]